MKFRDSESVFLIEGGGFSETGDFQNSESKRTKQILSLYKEKKKREGI